MVEDADGAEVEDGKRCIYTNISPLVGRYWRSEVFNVSIRANEIYPVLRQKSMPDCKL